ncbi:MAG: GFA family protein [Thermoleophilia bacterium]|nr:GFA family protein [Thermoleophilia bacterium]
MLKTYRGSCHCGAVTYEARIDLSKGTGRCNCTYCRKLRNWSARVEDPADLIVTAGEDTLAERVNEWHGGRVATAFCPTCGIATFTRGHIPEAGGAFASVQVSTLDDASPEEIIAAPVRYSDGLNDAWQNTPDEVRHL